jgi:hypothetical protein
MGQEFSQPIPCDAECERQKELSRLKGTYDIALRDEIIDTDEVRQARKHYYTYKLGEAGYLNKETEVLEKVVYSNIDELYTKYDELVNEFMEQERIKADNKIALSNMQDLLDKYKASNTKIKSSLDKQEDILETSRRKVWYTTQKNDKVDYYEKYIHLLMQLLLVIAIIYFLYKKRHNSLGLVITSYLLIMHFL